MKFIDLQKPHSWDELNESLRESVGDVLAAECQTFRGTGHALMETVQALAQLLAHKVQMCVLKGTGPFAQPLAVHFSRLGYGVESLRKGDLTDEAVLTPLFEKAKKWLCVVLERDNALTGELYAIQPIVEELNRLKVFTVVLNHSAHRIVRPKDILPYQIEICALSLQVAVAFMGDRCRARPLVAPQMDWSDFDLDALVRDLSGLGASDEEGVKAFEASHVAGAQPYFKADAVRIYDRAVCVWSDVDASAVRDEVNSCADVLALESASLCRWSRLEAFEWLDLDVERQRGLFVVGLELLHTDIERTLSQAHARVLERQGGPWPPQEWPKSLQKK